MSVWWPPSTAEEFRHALEKISVLVPNQRLKTDPVLRVNQSRSCRSSESEHFPRENCFPGADVIAQLEILQGGRWEDVGASTQAHRFISFARMERDLPSLLWRSQQQQHRRGHRPSDPGQVLQAGPGQAADDSPKAAPKLSGLTSWGTDSKAACMGSSFTAVTGSYIFGGWVFFPLIRRVER